MLGIWSKISAGLAAIVGFLLFWLKLKNKKIKEQEHEIEVHEVKDEIQEKQKNDIIEVLSDEQEQINEDIAKDDNKSKSDILDSMYR